mgnify:CR=1 FL=1
MNKPDIGDYVVIRGYFGNHEEIGRIEWLTDGVMTVHGIAQNNTSWLYTEFHIGFEKLTFHYNYTIDVCNVWIATKKSQ